LIDGHAVLVILKMDRTTCIYASLYVVTIHMQMHVVQFLYFKKKIKELMKKKLMGIKLQNQKLQNIRLYTFMQILT